MPEEINYSAMRFYWDVIQSLALLGLFIWTVIDKKRQGNSDEIKDLNEEVGKLDSRVQKLENTQGLMATHDDVSAIKVQLEGLNQKLSAVDHILKILHQHMLDKGESK